MFVESKYDKYDLHRQIFEKKENELKKRLLTSGQNDEEFVNFIDTLRQLGTANQALLSGNVSLDSYFVEGDLQRRIHQFYFSQIPIEEATFKVLWERFEELNFAKKLDHNLPYRDTFLERINALNQAVMFRFDKAIPFIISVKGIPIILKYTVCNYLHRAHIVYSGFRWNVIRQENYLLPLIIMRTFLELVLGLVGWGLRFNTINNPNEVRELFETREDIFKWLKQDTSTDKEVVDSIGRLYGFLSKEVHNQKTPFYRPLPTHEIGEELLITDSYLKWSMDSIKYVIEGIQLCSNILGSGFAKIKKGLESRSFPQTWWGEG